MDRSDPPETSHVCCLSVIPQRRRAAPPHPPAAPALRQISPQTFFHLLVPSGFSIKRPGTEQTNKGFRDPSADTNIDVGYEPVGGGGGVLWGPNTQHLPRTRSASVVHLSAASGWGGGEAW